MTASTTATSGDILLEATDLCIGYDGKSIADDLCFAVPRGASLCIVGENGTGKSTLLKTLAGLIKPIYGSVRFAVPRHQIGYLPQQSVIRQDFPASAGEIIASGALGTGAWYRPFLNKAEKERIAWATEKTGVAAFATQCYRELSGGQQQRVLLARALVTTQTAVLLDEPTAGLDAEAVRDFYALLHKLNRDDGITIIMVTHDMQGAAQCATHVLELKTRTTDDADDYVFNTIEAASAAQISSARIAAQGGQGT